MKFKLRDLATSATTLIFIVIAISGVMLYFKIFSSNVKQLHEILGLAFVVVAILHVFVNWKAMKNYFHKKTFISLTIVVALISAIFVSQTLNKSENPKSLIIKSVINAPLESSLKVLNIDYKIALDKLKEQNYKNLEKDSIMEIAKANKTNPFKLISIISSK